MAGKTEDLMRLRTVLAIVNIVYVFIYSSSGSVPLSCKQRKNKLRFNSELRSMAHVDMRGDSISQYWMLDGHATRQCHDKCFMTASYYHTGTWLHQAFSVLSAVCF